MYHQKRVGRRYDDPLTRISWQEFEQLLATYYAAQGYRVEHVGTGGSSTKFDGGIDLKLYRDNQYLIVQCKHWNVFQVTHNPVHELLGVMLTQHATGAIVITSGEFSRAARVAAAEEPRVTLIDGMKLREMLGPIAGLFVPSESGAVHMNVGGKLGGAEVNVPGYRSSRRRQPRSRNPLPGVAFAIVIGLVAYVAIMHTIKGIAPKTISLQAPSGAPPLSFAPPVAGAPSMAVATAVASAVPAPKDQVTHMTAAQQREWQRKNDEAMRILEKTTPTLER